jgi:hypothetical protein
MKFTLKICLFLAFFSVSTFSQTVFEFLKLDASPRTAALAGSFVAGSEDPNIIFYNPAGISTLKATPVSFSYIKHLLDVNMAVLSASHNFEGIGRFGAGIQYINYGSFNEMSDDGIKTGEFRVADFALTLGYANQFDSNFYYGVNAKFIYSGIQDRSSTALACDAGLLYLFPQSNFSIGFSALNLGSQTKAYYSTKEDLPVDMRLGFTKQFTGMPLKFYFSFNSLNEKADNFIQHFKHYTFGGEIRLSRVLKVRLGYNNQLHKDLKIGTTSGIAGLNLGVGITAGNYTFDYGFSSLGPVGSIHRFGLSTSL